MTLSHSDDYVIFEFISYEMFGNKLWDPRWTEVPSSLIFKYLSRTTTTDSCFNIVIGPLVENYFPK